MNSITAFGRFSMKDVGLTGPPLPHRDEPRVAAALWERRFRMNRRWEALGWLPPMDPDQIHLDLPDELD